MITALRNEFPDARLKGCFFHFIQCILRAINSKGLKQRYETDVEFGLKLRMLPAAAFVPTESVVEVFETLCENQIFPPEAQEVVDYFEDTWIGRPHRRQRRPPQFDLDMWNLYQSILEDLPKTNNSVEGWHRGFAERVGAMHANIWKFINYIRKEQSLNEIRIEQYVSGFEHQPQKKKYRDCARRIKHMLVNMIQIIYWIILEVWPHNISH
ncbi:hypothetical protein QE152_g9700 [Popillia japonica]|uniref:MULE transposase domain-containing protein n=1 Tax=Popillia japonica TaxID=7064 RepID=A0AAW1LXE6_POPJA